MTEALIFKEKQRFRYSLVWFIWIFTLFLILVSIISGGSFFYFVVIMGAISFLFYKVRFTVSINSHQVEINPGFWRQKKSIPLQEIIRVEVQRFKPLKFLEYGAWKYSPYGMRGKDFSWGKEGIAYILPNSQGGVEVELQNGDLFLIASQRPEELATALTNAKSV